LAFEKYTVMPAILLTFKSQKKTLIKEAFHHSLDERQKSRASSARGFNSCCARRISRSNTVAHNPSSTTPVF
jgi:hypothetical protein